MSKQTDAQINFVKNGGFEKYSTCPNNADEIKFADFWQPIDSIGSISFDSLGHIISFDMPLCSGEYCNACDTSVATPRFGMPTGIAYNHQSRSGKGMVEVQMYFDNSYVESYQRDYIQGHFFNHLTAGVSYCVTFFVGLEQLSQYAINHIGAYIDDGTIDTGQDSAGCASVQTIFHPQIVEDSIITDTLNWFKVQGTYTATGNETFITIGNFFDIYHTDTIKRALIYPPWNTANPASWYLIDDVSVIESNSVADAGLDQWVSPGSDSVFIGITDEGLPTTWYILGNPTPLCYGSGGFNVHPDTTTSYVVVLDLCDVVTSDTVTIHVAPVEVQNIQNRQGEISMYPNPAKEVLTICGASGYNAKLIDGCGQVVMTIQIISNQQSIKLLEVPEGVYALELTDNATKERIVKKVVIDKM